MSVPPQLISEFDTNSYESTSLHGATPSGLLPIHLSHQHCLTGMGIVVSSVEILQHHRRRRHSQYRIQYLAKWHGYPSLKTPGNTRKPFNKIAYTLWMVLSIVVGLNLRPMSLPTSIGEGGWVHSRSILWTHGYVSSRGTRGMKTEEVHSTIGTTIATGLWPLTLQTHSKSFV